MVSSRYILLTLGLPALVRGTQYALIKEYAGTNFFDDWDFFGNIDNLTHGDATFVNASQAASDRLAFVNSAGNAIMKVDNTTVVPLNSKRDTVRITSKDLFGVGSVWIADMLHVPFGCSVWPAFWSSAPAWPTGGEIDTFEGVNMVLNAQMALHTDPGCTLVDPTQTSSRVTSTDCSVANQNLGCVVKNPDPNSYGAAFAAAGGGMFVTELASTGISCVVFRANIPSSLQKNSTIVDTSTFGVPVANYPAGGCNIDKFFQPQNLIFDITLCGDFAGNSEIFPQTCSGSCYNDFVIGPPRNYDNAYFEVRSVRVFGTSSAIEVEAVLNTGRNSTGTVGPSGNQTVRRRGTRMHWSVGH
ncbi:concanavalin A-like lectin/glucanase domain-containing protein [Lactarius akahatsu]|uniref:Concanavalin A-like lectin/glucanase domain-containing protein n=1 Tax=Lactarius akahatsu TaxID=416441 RepID=A0AAD4LGF9_9AGAM|nr:concanavalin A-like lectin/glucanase domain-containing protein [Lactarius akahatsu]